MFPLKTKVLISWATTLSAYKLCLYCPDEIIHKAIMGSELLMQARQKKGAHGGVTRQEFEEAYAGSRD